MFEDLVIPYTKLWDNIETWSTFQTFNSKVRNPEFTKERNKGLSIANFDIGLKVRPTWYKIPKYDPISHLQEGDLLSLLVDEHNYMHLFLNRKPVFKSPRPIDNVKGYSFDILRRTPIFPICEFLGDHVTAVRFVPLDMRQYLLLTSKLKKPDATSPSPLADCRLLNSFVVHDGVGIGCRVRGK